MASRASITRDPLDYLTRQRHAMRGVGPSTGWLDNGEYMVGRYRGPVAPCDGARAALVRWLRDLINEQGMSYVALAGGIRYDRSWLSRALSGRVMPPWPMVSRIVDQCSASADTAERLWAAANAAWRQRDAREADGHPPADCGDYAAFVEALRDLLARRGISQRELVRRDQSGLLRRSTVGTHLRRERPISREVTLAMVRACDGTEAAVSDWADMWDQLGRPHLAASARQRRHIYIRSQRSYVYRYSVGGR